MPSEAGPGSRPVTAIAAVCRNGVIGDGHDQPWSHRDDFARFKRLTRGGALIMGRRTYEAIGRPLPGRLSVVITRTAGWRPEGLDPDALPEGTAVLAAGSLDEAFAVADRERADGPLVVAGGGEIYRAALSRTDVVELTEVDQDCAGTVTFPVLDPDDWVEVAAEQRDGFRWVTLHRRR